jgi:hypothetical protein
MQKSRRDLSEEATSMPTQPCRLYSRLTRAGADAADITGLLDEVAALDAEQQAHELGDCMSAIIQSPSLSVWALGRWLTTNTDIAAAKRMVHELSVSYLAADVAVRFDLSTLNPSNAVLAGFRLCALGAAPPVSLGWVLALLGLPDEAAQADALKLLQHHMQEYPYTTQRLLDDADAELKAALPVLAEAASMLKQQADALEQAPRLKEFALSREERIALQGLKLREQREIHCHAEQHSVLRAFAKQSHFKYSREAVVEITAQGQTFEQVLSMQSHGASVELPLSERLEPLTGPLRRNRLWGGTAS